MDNYWCHSVFFSTAVDKSKSHSPQVSGQYRNSNSGSSAAANGVEGGFAASGDGSSPTSFQSAGVSATAHQQKFHSNAIVTSEPRDTIRLVHRLHSLFPTPYSATTVAASATANRAVVAVATAGLYRDQLYRLPQSSRDVFATLHERYHPKHLIKANMLANLRRAELKRQKEHAQEHQYTVQRQTALQPESYASIRPSVKQPRGSFFRRSFFLMRFGNTDAQRTDAFPGRVKRVSSKMGCSDLPEVSMGQHYSLHNTPRDRVDGHQSGEEDVGAPLGAANTAASKIRNIDRPGMRFVTIFCDDQKVRNRVAAFHGWMIDYPCNHIILAALIFKFTLICLIHSVPTSLCSYYSGATANSCSRYTQ